MLWRRQKKCFRQRRERNNEGNHKKQTLSITSLTTQFNTLHPRKTLGRSSINKLVLKHGYGSCKMIQKIDVSPKNKKLRIEFVQSY